MKASTISVMVATSLMLGCDYKVSLDTDPKTVVSKDVIGTWQRKDRDTKLFITKFDDHYYYAGVSGGPGVIACPVALDGIPLVQTEAVHSRETEVFVKYGYLRAVITNGEMRLAVLNPTIISEAIANAEDLRSAIKTNRNERRLFVEPAVFLKKTDTVPDEFLLGLKKIRPVFEAVHSGQKVDSTLMRE